MDMQLQEMIEQIKKNGIEAAEAEAAAILASARAEAETIVSEAKREAERAIEEAKRETARLVRVSEESIRQAGRNLLLSFRESVNKELNAIIGDSVKEVYSPASLAALIIKVVEAWTQNTDAEEIAVLLSAEDLQALEAQLLSALKNKIGAGVVLKASDSLDGGFRIAVSDGRAYYDYSAAAVVELLSAYLNPRVTALLKEAEGV